jgi:hypothetical protein
MKTIWNKETGEAREYEGVDAREILANSPELYTDVDPKGGNPKDLDGDGEGTPQNVANVENEFRREPVGDNPPAKERDEVIIRNPVTDQPRMAEPAATAPVVDDRTVARGPQGLFYVMKDGERVSKGFKTEDEAKAELSN